MILINVPKLSKFLSPAKTRLLKLSSSSLTLYMSYFWVKNSTKSYSKLTKILNELWLNIYLYKCCSAIWVRSFQNCISFSPWAVFMLSNLHWFIFIDLTSVFRYRMPSVGNAVSPTKDVSVALSSNLSELASPRKIHKRGVSKPKELEIHSRSCSCRRHTQERDQKATLKSRSLDSLRKEVSFTCMVRYKHSQCLILLFSIFIIFLRNVFLQLFVIE